MENLPQIIENNNNNDDNIFDSVKDLIEEINQLADKNIIAQTSSSYDITPLSSNMDDSLIVLTPKQEKMIEKRLDEEENILNELLLSNENDKIDDDINYKFLIKNVIALKEQQFLLMKEVEDLKLKNLSKDLNIPETALKNIWERKKLRMSGFGKAYIPLLKLEIDEALQRMGTMIGAAKYLGVSYVTFKKYAQLYNIWIPSYNRKENKLSRNYAPPILEDRLNEGTYAKHVSAAEYVEKLISTNSKKAECEECGYNKKRESDGKVSLIMMFKDMNYKNFKLENIKFICYNCAYNIGLIKYNTYQGAGRLVFNANINNNEENEELPDDLKDLNNQNIEIIDLKP